MNPRRRGNTLSEKTDGMPSTKIEGPLQAIHEPGSQPALAMAATQQAYIDQQQQSRSPPVRHRNRLRKISSEGGSIAARARNQAMAAEFGLENLRSPAFPVFPNRSATSLSMNHEGGMF
jgi:hypothetical protein